LPKKNYSQKHLGFCIPKMNGDGDCYKHFDIPDHVTFGLIPGSVNDISNPFGLLKDLFKFNSTPFLKHYRLISAQKI